MAKFGSLTSLSLMSNHTEPEWRYPSLLHFPSLTKLQLHVDSHAPHRFTCLNDLDQLLELRHLSLEFIVQGMTPILPDTCSCLDVLPRIKRLDTLDVDLKFEEAGRYYIPIWKIVMEKIRAAAQVTSLGLNGDVALLRKGLHFLTEPATPATPVIGLVDPQVSAFVSNLRELRLNGKMNVLPPHQKEVFTALSKFAALTSLKISNLPSPPEDFLAGSDRLCALRELDFTQTNPGKEQVDWMQTFSTTLQKIVMPATKAGDALLVKKYIEVIAAMPLVREIVLPPTFLTAFQHRHNDNGGESLRHVFVDELRKLRPEIQFS